MVLQALSPYWGSAGAPADGPAFSEMISAVLFASSCSTCSRLDLRFDNDR